MKSLACGVLLAAFLLVSSPSFSASYAGSAANIAYVMDIPALPRQRRRRNHYNGEDFLIRGNPLHG